VRGKGVRLRGKPFGREAAFSFRGMRWGGRGRGGGCPAGGKARPGVHAPG
jgi:hypothetical protein